jgi:LysR family transcriptional regulator, carnitine catabolism transcriptional activator
VRDIPDLSAKHLQAVIALARFESFVAAASDLGISQPGLSRIIQQAESRVGVKLFVRGTRTVSPTEAGREFIPAAVRFLGELLQQTQKIRTLDGQMRGQLIISSLMSISHHVLPSALVDYRKRHPRMYLHVREGLAADVQEDVRSGLADFGIGNTDALPGGILAASIAEEPCYIVLPSRHPLVQRSLIRLKDLANESMISMPSGSWLQRRIDVAAHEQGIVLKHSIITNLCGSQLEFVAAGLGLAIIPAAVLPLSNEYPIVVRPLRPEITRRIGILRLAERPLSVASEAFLDFFLPKFLAVIGRRHPRQLRLSPSA